MDVESIAIIVFVAFLIVLLYLNRKKVAVQKLLYPLLYFVLWRTKVGLKLMDKAAKRWKKPLHYISYVMIAVGFAGMALIVYELGKSLVLILTKPAAVQAAGLVLPIQAKGIFYVPFSYWIISIFILAVVHEFSHGIIARLHKIRIKSSGFAFLCLVVPVLPAAFVEPDEKQMKKKSRFQQLGVLAAGSFTNIALGLILLLVFNFAAAPLITSVMDFNGVAVSSFDVSSQYPAVSSGISVGDVIYKVDGIAMKYHANFSDYLSDKKPGDIILLETDKGKYNITLAKHPGNASLGYMGIYATQNTMLKPSFVSKYGKFSGNAILWLFGRPFSRGEVFSPGLISWLIILNIGIGLFNLAPIGPIDGGRMLLIALEKYLPHKKAQFIWMGISLLFLLIVIVNVGFGFFK